MLDLAGSIEEQRTAQGVEVPGMVKTASDLRRYEKLFATVNPAWIVELGTYRGISARWFADTAHCRVVSVDTHPQVDEDTWDHPDITWMKGNSADPYIVRLIRGLIDDEGPVVVVCDSDHSAQHVLAEMEAYAHLVTPGSYMVVEDGIVRWLPEQLPHYHDSSPLDAIEVFLREHHEWAPDIALENMLPTTQNPLGYVRRVH